MGVDVWMYTLFFCVFYSKTALCVKKNKGFKKRERRNGQRNELDPEVVVRPELPALMRGRWDSTIQMGQGACRGRSLRAVETEQHREGPSSVPGVQGRGTEGLRGLHRPTWLAVGSVLPMQPGAGPSRPFL